MIQANIAIKKAKAAFGMILVLAGLGAQQASAQSLDIPSKAWGVSIGNSREFAGLRFNFRDSRVVRVTGVNVTLWQPKKDNKSAVVRGLSLGLIPGGGDMAGLQLGILGPAAETKMTGLNLGLIGIGAGAPKVRGLAVAGIGVGGVDLTGAFLAGAMVRVEQEGRLTGLAVSAVNYLKGTLNGVSIGLVNYAWHLAKGFQLGLVNIVRDNPPGLKVLPVFNTHFK